MQKQRRNTFAVLSLLSFPILPLPDLSFQGIWQINLIKLNWMCIEALCAQNGCSFPSFLCPSSQMSPLPVSPTAIINPMSLYIVFSFMQIVSCCILLSRINGVQWCVYM